jgi:drug/metabolite transporter (DMT)-like permease
VARSPQAALALTGTALLCNDGAGVATGDLWCAAAAVASAAFILRLEKLGSHGDPTVLTAYVPSDLEESSCKFPASFALPSAAR